MTLVTPRADFRQIVGGLRSLGFCGLIPGNGKKPRTPFLCYQQQPPTARQIEIWARLWPFAGVLILTGLLFGFFVVDVDAVESIEYVEIRGMPPTWLVRTRRGFHYYYRWPDFLVRSSASKLFPGLDIKGVNSYVVAPGNPNYEWVEDCNPTQIALADPPSWLLNELRPKPLPEYHQDTTPIVTPSGLTLRASAAFERELERVAAARPGTRNSVLCAASYSVGQLVGSHELERDAVIAALVAAAAPWDTTDSWRRSTLRTITEALERGQRSPRSAPRLPV